jgi:thioredoxin-dependent peroxiredoxin
VVIQSPRELSHKKKVLPMKQLLFVPVIMALLAGAAQASKPDREKAFDFKAPTTSGKTVSLNELKGRWVVLYFYPKADTPGCTKESCSLRDGYEQISKTGAVILGVSLDSMESQKAFKKKYELPFELVSDADKKIARAYGALGLMGFYASRKTFLIDPDGYVARVLGDVDVSHHDSQVLKALEELKAKPAR